MSSPALAAAFALSLLGPLARYLPGATGPGPGWLGAEVSLTGLALLGWIALAGLPRRRAGPAPPETLVTRGAQPLSVVGLALPALGVSAAGDLAAGHAPIALAWTAGAGLLLVGLLAAGAERARGAFAHGLLWWCAVPLAALLPAVSSWARGGAEGWVRLSPLGWAYLRALPGEVPSSGATAASLWVPLLAPLGVALALLMCAGPTAPGADRP